MTVRNDILQRIRSFLKVACLTGGASLTDAQVVKAEDVVKGGATRATPPFLTVKIVVSDRQVGTDESIIQNGVDPDFAFFARGLREATVSVQGFGEATSDWLARAKLRLLDPVLLATVLSDPATGEGITMQPFGGMRDLSAVLGDSWEARYLQEFLVSYELRNDDDKQTAPATATIVTDMTFESDSDAGDFSRTITAP